jgi:HSP20 family protein
MTIYISPSRRLSELRRAMDNAMEETIADLAPREREMTLAVDVLANDDGYSIRTLVPGLSSEDLNIEILNNTVAIRGEFKSQNDAEEARYLTCELPNGRFARVITLPTALDPAKADANLKDGVLKLWVPKAEAHKPKSIKVNIG